MSGWKEGRRDGKKNYFNELHVSVELRSERVIE